MIQWNVFLAQLLGVIILALDSDHIINIAPNLLRQDFTASWLSQKWAGGIAYVWKREGWGYLAVIIDHFSRASLDGPSVTASSRIWPYGS